MSYDAEGKIPIDVPIVITLLLLVVVGALLLG